MSEPSQTPVFDLGKALAKAEAEKLSPGKKSTSVEVALDADGTEKGLGVEATHQRAYQKFTVAVAGWYKRKFQKDGHSGGASGKIEW